MRSLLPIRRRHAQLAVDGLVLAWCVVWVLVALRVAVEVRDVGRISATVARVGTAVSQTGSTLQTLESLPLVGDRIAETGAPIREAGDAAQESALQSRESANELSVLLGLAIALVPTLPLLLVHVPRRVALERERRAVARALARSDASSAREVLAWRAITNLPFDRLNEVSRNPWDDLARGRHDALAEAELARLGLRSGTG